MSTSSTNSLIMVSTASGDWHALYVDGKEHTQGHDIYTDTWIEMIYIYRHKEFVFKKYEVTDEYADMYGELPELFEEIPKEHLS